MVKLQSRTEPKLKREVGLAQLVFYGVGNIIGAGIYVLVGGAAGLAGNAVGFAFLIGAAIALFTGLSYAELAAMYPKAASEYTYLGKAYGNHFLSFITQWMMLATELVASAAVALGFAQYFQSVLASPTWLVAIVLLAILTLIGITGVKRALRFNTVFSIIAIIGLLIVIAAGAPRFGSVNYAYSPGGLTGILGAAALVFFAYIGFDNIANLSEETKNPQKTLPRGLLISVAISTVLYVLVGIAAVSIVPFQQLATSNAPLASAASGAFGPVAYDIITIAGLLTTLNTVLVLLIVGSRIIYGMSREGVLPRVLGRVNPRTRTPIFASLATFAVALLFIPIGNVGEVAKITSFGSLLAFILVNTALLHLRRTAPHLKRPFKVPVNIGWVSVTALLGVITSFALLTQFDLQSALLGMSLPISGVILYLLFNHGKIFAIDSRLHQHHEEK
ncbi:MAG: amino acid permease [Candidatus Micrarchaeota archaeon]|nr:amino acid permease [Candidatus Micrarchaeota archaeon]